MKGISGKAFLVYLIGFMVARASFYGIDPLAIAYFMAVCSTGLSKGIGGIVIFLGLATVLEPMQVVKYTLAMVATIIFLESPLLKNRNIPKGIYYCVAPIFIELLSFVDLFSQGVAGTRIGFIVLEGVVAVIGTFIFKQGIDYILQSGKGYKMTNEQMVSVAVLMAIVIYAIPQYQNSFFSPLETIVYFIVLFFTYKYGVGQGTITGAVCGFALFLRGANVADIGMYTMMGIIAAIFREMGRFPTAMIYMMMAAVMGVVNKDMELTIPEISALVSAVIAFLLIPSNLIYRVDAAGGTGRQEQLAAQNLKKIAKARMKIFSESFLKLSKTLDTIAEQQTKIKQQEVNRIFEDISEKLCKNCDQCSDCWEHNFQQTYQAASLMFEKAQEKGTLGVEDIPLEFLSDCISAEDFIAETNRGFEIAKLNRIWHHRISESREVIAEQLKEVSTVIQEITGDIYETSQGARSDEERVIRALRAEHIHVKEITIFERGDNRKEVYITAACQSGRCVTAKETASIISEVLDNKMKVSEASKSVITKEYDSFAFMTDTKFKVLTGVSRAMKENVSGDNFSLLKLESGEFMIAISDGMGTGEEAAKESETVMSLLEQMIEAGFRAETAIKLINSSLVLKADQQTFSTVDLNLINLFSGMCEFIKIGAAATFIKRDNWVETITSTTLPIGMFGNVDYDTVTKKLYEGDIIIMVTDGVLDCIEEEDKEAYMEHLIMEIKSNNVQEIANRILEATLSKSNYVPRDDMTVITAGIWLK
jgi:stage II sporulation protein E